LSKEARDRWKWCRKRLKTLIRDSKMAPALRLLKGMERKVENKTADDRTQRSILVTGVRFGSCGAAENGAKATEKPES
jgi:hypothetical protein